MILEESTQTCWIVDDLNAIDDEMGDKVTLEGLIKRKFLLSLKHTLEDDRFGEHGWAHNEHINSTIEMVKKNTENFVEYVLKNYIKCELSYMCVDKVD